MNGTPVRVLIADDEPALLRMMSVFLRRLGYEVETTGVEEEARQRLSNVPLGLDVAVLDASMLSGDFAEFASSALLRDPELRLIVASGYPMDVGALETEAPGRVAFLQKPFAPETLGSMVRRMIGGQEAVQRQ